MCAPAERPDVTQVGALTAAGAKTLNFSSRPGVIRMESNSTLQLNGIVIADTAPYSAEEALNVTYRSGLAVYPSVISEPDATVRARRAGAVQSCPECVGPSRAPPAPLRLPQVIYSNTAINFWNADCEVSTFNGITFRLGLALQNASAVGLLDPTTAYILGTTPLEFPLRKLPDLDSTGGLGGLLWDYWQCIWAGIRHCYPLHCWVL